VENEAFSLEASIIDIDNNYDKPNSTALCYNQTSTKIISLKAFRQNQKQLNQFE
jgi:hypothetical protein